MDQGDIGGSWHHFSNSVYSASKEVMGIPNRKHQDWFDDQDADMLTRFQVNKAIASLSVGKALGSDGIFISGCPALFEKIFELLCAMCKNIPP